VTFKSKYGILSVIAIAGLLSLSTPAGASTVYDLNIISKASIGSGSLGTVTPTQIGSNEVDVLVSLIADTAFVSKDGPHDAFAFSLERHPRLDQNNEPTRCLFGTPFGAFTNVISCPSCGPGASNANPGPLAVAVIDSDGISIGDFLANTNGFFFSADDRSLGAQVISPRPIPAALPLFASGLGAIGLLGWWRKRKAQAIA
jgi:hypothetical protein